MKHFLHLCSTYVKLRMYEKAFDLYEKVET